MKLVLLAVAALFVQLVNERVGEAYKLEPISRVFAPAGSGATQSFQLTNSSAERVAVTISFTTLELDSDHCYRARLLMGSACFRSRLVDGIDRGSHRPR